jgi:GNAT superfamily N-acetyltransferase
MMTGKQVVIRNASAADALLLAEMGAKTFYDTFAPQNTPENMKAYLASSFSLEKQAAELSDAASFYLIAEVEGSPAGFALLRTGVAPSCVRGTHPIEVVRIYALKEWIGHGVGHTLMQACLEEAGRRGCDTLWLGVWEHNPRAITFYRKWQFEEVGSHPFQLGSELQRDLLMQRPVRLTS